MLEPETIKQLQNEDLFVLFAQQLRKDFESSGLPADFVDRLSRDFETLRTQIAEVLEPLHRHHSANLPILLYRVDLSEHQLRKYSAAEPDLSFEMMLAGLIIKRILQKIILRKTFSK